MPPHFLTVRFPLVFLGDDCLDRLQDPPPVHEKEGHVFYQTDLRIVADKLLELFRHGNQDAAAWNPLAPVSEFVEKGRHGEPADLFPTPVFDVVNGANLDLTRRVRFRRDVQQLQEIAPNSFLGPEGWALLGFPNDRRTVLLVQHYEQARQLEPLVRDELNNGESAYRISNGSTADVRDLELDGSDKPLQDRVWIWALRPLERDHTPNMCCSIDDSPGCIVQMLHDDRTGAAIPASLAPDNGGAAPTTRGRRTLAELRDNAPPAGGWRIWHRYYRPTEKDLSILKAAYPDADPRNPNWLNLKRDLVCHGHASDVLAQAEVPVLLGLLAKVKKSDTDSVQNVVLTHRPCQEDFAQEGQTMPKKARIRAEELPPIAAALRQVAARLEAEKPVREKSKAWHEQEDRFWADRCEAARLFLAALEAGAFADDYRLHELIEQTKELTDRDTVGDWQEHLKCYLFNVSSDVVEEWMPERWPDSIVGSAKGPGEGNEYNEHRWYAANLRILADKIEAFWAISQPVGITPKMTDLEGQEGNTRPAEDETIKATAENMKTANLPKTLGALLNAVEASEVAYRQNIAVAEREQQAHGSSAALWWRMQAEILRFRPTVSEWPGVDFLEAICQVECGGGPAMASYDLTPYTWASGEPLVPLGSVSGLTADNLRRIRGKLIVNTGIVPARVDSMTIQQVVDEFQRLKRPASDGDVCSSSFDNKAAILAPPGQTAAYLRDKVFISYSHKDKKFLDELLMHLRPLIRNERISVWSDKKIQPGVKWLNEISQAIASAKVAVLLVTKDFLASDFIHEHEFEPLLKEAKQGGVRILWVPVRACAYEETPLKDYQALTPPDKPLAQMNAERDGAWVRICQEIKNAMIL
jgi:hypothetical protein